MRRLLMGAALAASLAACARAADAPQGASAAPAPAAPAAPGVEAPKMRLPTDVRRATIIVRDMEKSLALYRDVIGLAGQL